QGRRHEIAAEFRPQGSNGLSSIVCNSRDQGAWCEESKIRELAVVNQAKASQGEILVEQGLDAPRFVIQASL
ncbi:hypothetical protein ABTI69_22415, partial [Acinetobacter baumannii]